MTEMAEWFLCFLNVVLVLWFSISAVIKLFFVVLYFSSNQVIFLWFSISAVIKLFFVVLYFSIIKFFLWIYISAVIKLFCGSLFQHDVFELEAVSLDEVERIVVSHDNKGSDPAWYLDKVIVRSEETPDKDYRFNCGRSVHTCINSRSFTCTLYVFYNNQVNFNAISAIFYQSQK